MRLRCDPGGAIELRSPTTARASTRREVRSRSLGLTTMHERAKDIGGALQVDSQPGAGTTVRLTVTP